MTQTNKKTNHSLGTGLIILGAAIVGLIIGWGKQLDGADRLNEYRRYAEAVAKNSRGTVDQNTNGVTFHFGQYDKMTPDQQQDFVKQNEFTMYSNWVRLGFAAVFFLVSSLILLQQPIGIVLLYIFASLHILFSTVSWAKFNEDRGIAGREVMIYLVLIVVVFSLNKKGEMIQKG